MDARRIGLHGANLLGDRGRVLAQHDRVAIGFRHLLAIETGHLGRLGQQRLRFWEDHSSRPFEIAEQPLAIAQRQILRLVEHLPRRFERFLVALFLKRRAQLLVALGALRAKLLDRGLRFFLEPGLAPVDVIEAARELAHELHVRDLILADRHHIRAIKQDVGALHHRIAQKTVRRQISVAQSFLLLLVRRHALQPTHGRDHAEQ